MLVEFGMDYHMSYIDMLVLFHSKNIYISCFLGLQIYL